MLITDYCDYSAPINTPRRYDYCPFCKRYVKSQGFVVTRTYRGFLMWCHRCHKKKFVRAKTPTATQVLAIARNATGSEARSTHAHGAFETVHLPYDFTPEIPELGLAWLYKYQVTDGEIHKYRFGYSPKMDRLVLPVFKDEELVFWQGRYLGHARPDQPKYLSISKKADNVWFEIKAENKPIVLVEDILSAVAVARAGYGAIALLGTYMREALLPHLLRSEAPAVYVWLDPDMKTRSAEHARRLSSFGLTSRAILVADKDPKEYSPDQIQSFIEGGTDDQHGKGKSGNEWSDL